MMAPGSGAGNQAAAIAQVKAVMSPLHRALAAVPVGSKEYKGILAALRALAPIFGEAQDGNLVPAAVAQMGQAAKSGGSPLSAVAPGLQPQMTPPSGGPSPLAAAA
jgi:hypothetical protein